MNTRNLLKTYGLCPDWVLNTPPKPMREDFPLSFRVICPGGTTLGELDACQVPNHVQDRRKFSVAAYDDRVKVTERKIYKCKFFMFGSYLLALDVPDEAWVVDPHFHRFIPKLQRKRIYSR